jgi:hypothetical protein
LCREQQQRFKIGIDHGNRLLEASPVSKPASLAFCILFHSLSFYLVRFSRYLEIPSRERGPASFACPVRQELPHGSIKWHTGDVACPLEKSAIVIIVEGLNRKALEEVGRWKTVAN